MAFEIELKVRLNDFAPVKEQLSVLGNYLRSYKKSDSYWFSGDVMPGVRIRRESGVGKNGETWEMTLVTYKKKEISGGIEVNDEREFTVSDAGLFEELLGRLGLSKDICKEKEGWAWTVPSATTEQFASAQQTKILAELSMVTGLGWFLELEIIADTNDDQVVAESRKRLLALLADLHIPEEWIEARPYTAMLREIK